MLHVVKVLAAMVSRKKVVVIKIVMKVANLETFNWLHSVSSGFL